MSKRPVTSTKPKVEFKDGTIGHLLSEGPDQSLILIDDREQYYPNGWFKPYVEPVLIRRRRRALKG